METNEMPEKIYITPNIDRMWQGEAIDNESVEYIQIDAFIEKACKAYCKTCKMPNCYSSNGSKCKFLNNFRENMKGE